MKIYQEVSNSSNNDIDRLTARQREANILKKIAQTYRHNSSEYGKKEQLLKQSLAIYQEIGDRLGLVYSLLGNLETALELYNLELEALKKASQFYTQLGDSETASIFEYRQPLVALEMGKIYAQLEDNRNEVEAYNQARIIYQKLQDYEGEVYFLIEIAERYEKQENLERMEEFLNHAVTVYRETGDRLQEANFLRERIAGFYLYRLEPSEKGLETLNQALKIYQEIGNQTEIAKTLYLIGFFYSSALRRAQLEMQTETEWQSPHYWAAFTLQGEWR
ncbi:MAG: hypothetical protein AAFO04_14995 [Cyanobacteria bacterium J06592_8]